MVWKCPICPIVSSHLNFGQFGRHKGLPGVLHQHVKMALLW